MALCRIERLCVANPSIDKANAGVARVAVETRRKPRYANDAPRYNTTDILKNVRSTLVRRCCDASALLKS
jgi:hypothetical protein